MSKPPLPSYDQALARILPYAPPLRPQRVRLDQALGRVLWEPVLADRDQPPFDRSAMDGFAVRLADVAAGRRLPVAGAVPAGAALEVVRAPLEAGAARRIATGAPVPAGAEAVVPVELAEVHREGGREMVAFSISEVEPWANVHRQGSDARARQEVIPRGTRLGPQHLGIAAAVGAVELVVAEPPRVTLLTTGDEVRPPETPAADLQPQQIRNANGPMVAALLRTLGIDLLAHHHLPDEPEETLAAAREALSHSHLVLTVGGVSVGQRDFLPGTWKRLGLETVVHGVAIQPGKPVLAAAADCKLVLGLPGNPVSVLATFHLVAWAVLGRMLGEDGSDRALPWRRVRLAESAHGSARREIFRAARLEPDGRARLIAWHGSGDLVHTAAAQGLLRLPLSDEPVPAGRELDYLPLLGGQ